MPKTYRATFLLGVRSETDDIESDLLPVDNAEPPTEQMLQRELRGFIGTIQQRPPAHSAIKLEGRRAYDLARRGVALDLPARAVRIHSLLVERYEYPELELEINCGSGTYVRSLGRDLGDALGTGAVMLKLQRTSIGRFTLQNAIQLENLSTATLADLQPITTAVAELPKVTLTPAQMLELRNGRPILTAWLPAGTTLPPDRTDVAAFDSAGHLAAIVFEKLPGELWPRFNFNQSPSR
jgi:tRNA pseudouridine55 synthase